MICNLLFCTPHPPQMRRCLRSKLLKQRHSVANSMSRFYGFMADTHTGVRLYSLLVRKTGSRRTGKPPWAIGGAFVCANNENAARHYLVKISIKLPSYDKAYGRCFRQRRKFVSNAIAFLIPTLFHQREGLF